MEEAEEARRKEREEFERSRIEQRVIREVPIEVTKNIQRAVETELDKLRREMNFQQKLLTEEVVNLRVRITLSLCV